jgi:hypothetical protein
MAAFGSSLFSASFVFADITYKDGGTHTINTPMAPTNIWVENSTTLNIATGGSITGTPPVQYADAIFCDVGTVNVNGGSVTAANLPTSNTAVGIWSDDGAVTVNSGTVTGGTSQGYSFAIDADSSTITINGGTITGGNTTSYGTAIAADRCSMNVYGGTIAAYTGCMYPFSIDGGKINVYGGTLKGGICGEADPVNIYGGSITASGARCNYGVQNNGGVSKIYGGSITVHEGSSWNYGLNCESGEMGISGGSLCIDGIGATGGGAAVMAFGGNVDIWGGQISFDGISAPSSVSAALETEGGTINVYGSGFDYPYGPITAAAGTLTGTLTDGSPINLSFWQENTGSIILNPAPEPATLSLLILGGVAMLRRRKA